MKHRIPNFVLLMGKKKHFIFLFHSTYCPDKAHSLTKLQHSICLTLYHIWSNNALHSKHIQTRCVTEEMKLKAERLKTQHFRRLTLNGKLNCMNTYNWRLEICLSLCVNDFIQTSKRVNVSNEYVYYTMKVYTISLHSALKFIIFGFITFYYNLKTK